MKSKSIATVAIAVGLLVGSVVGVEAQDDAASTTSYFTWDPIDPPTFGEDPATGLPVVTVEIEATDPRAAGMLANHEDFRHDADDDRFRVGGVGLRLVNDGGAWVGVGRGVAAARLVDGDDVGASFSEYVGEGGYDGLTMFTFSGGVAGRGNDRIGFIVPTDIVPEMPGPPTE